MRVLRALLAGAVLSLMAPAGGAFPIRVSTATELMLDPQVSADRRELTLAVRLRDDSGAGVEGRPLAITTGNGEGPTLARTDAHGEFSLPVPVPPQVGVVHVEARFAGDARFAAASVRADVELDAPFVTLELSVPPAALSVAEAAPPFRVRVDTGHAAWLSPRELPVDLVAVEGGGVRVLAAALTDDVGLATLALPAGAFPRAGVYQVRPRVELRTGRLVEGAGRTVLVRAATTLAAALVSDPDDSRVRIRGRLRTTDAQPVAGAPVRLMRGDETVAAVRTDPAGEFLVGLDLDRAPLAGSVLRARFDPSDPCFVASESGGIRVGEAPAPPIHWAWMVAPWVALALAGFGLLARRRPAPPPAPLLPVEVNRDAVVRTGDASDGAVEVVVEAFDRSTGAALPAARYRLADVDASERAASASVTLTTAQAVRIVVSVAGYETRAVDVGRLVAGRHALRVGLLGWREAVFDRARPALAAAAAADGAVMPTPREAAEATSAEGGRAPWAELVERGAYGPSPPDGGTVHAVESALGGAEAAANDGSDAVDAVN